MADTMEHAFAKVCEVFGIESLNKHQEDAIKYVVEEKKDVFVNLPTGFGKSLIYQALPLVYSCLQSTVEKNIIVVISPLTSLMKDQVMRLISLGITAISLAEITTEKQCNEVKNGDYSVVFGSPELWLGDEKWRKMAMSDCYRKSVRAVAVDEAHVICHW